MLSVHSTSGRASTAPTSSSIIEGHAVWEMEGDRIEAVAEQNTNGEYVEDTEATFRSSINDIWNNTWKTQVKTMVGAMARRCRLAAVGLVSFSFAVSGLFGGGLLAGLLSPGGTEDGGSIQGFAKGREVDGRGRGGLPSLLVFILAAP